MMKHHMSIAGLVVVGMTVSGCGGNAISRLMGGGPSTPQDVAQPNADLSMPPDMNLRAPGTAVASAAQPDIPGHPYQSSGMAPAPVPAIAQQNRTMVAAPAPSITQGELNVAAAPAPVGDVYDRNGISKFHPDGKAKTKGELSAELKKVLIAKKRQQNPGYGTIFNIGNIFKDG